ncbi:AAA family ATPase [Kinneretia aquatilis]|nr:DUF3696 domain-containing protein [Paucibacter aquatile]
MHLLSLKGVSQPLKKLQRALTILKLDELLSELDESMLGFCNGVSYLEPLRATAQRYYRREEVSIEELDPKGLNTTFFLQGLTQRERDSLNEWLSSTFGFKLLVKTAGGHSSLNIETEAGNESRNMADVGLGYSQLVPVAIQLWVASRKHDIRVINQRNRAIINSRVKYGGIVVIEQPELHLHPAYQAKLADVFASCIAPTEPDEGGRHGQNVKIMAETHSPNLINRLGELIDEGLLSAEDVQVLVFEPSRETSGGTRIEVASFDEHGVLQNWPIGFFDY